MTTLKDRIKQWKVLKKKGENLPRIFNCSVQYYLSHTDKQKHEFETFCAMNGIKFEVI